MGRKRIFFRPSRVSEVQTDAFEIDQEREVARKLQARRWQIDTQSRRERV